MKKRKTVFIAGGGYEITFTSDASSPVPESIHLAGGPEWFLRALYDATRSVAPRTVGGQDYAEFVRIARGRDAFARVWPLFVSKEPPVPFRYVTRGSEIGVTYVVLYGAAIVYNRDSLSHDIHLLEHGAGIGEGSEYHFDPSGPKVSSCEETDELYAFLKAARLTVGGFVELMLAATETPLPREFEALFDEFHVPRIHARLRSLVRGRHGASILIGTHQVFLEHALDPKLAKPSTLVPVEFCPWLAAATMQNATFWLRLLALVREKFDDGAVLVPLTTDPSSPPCGQSKRHRSLYENVDDEFVPGTQDDSQEY